MEIEIKTEIEIEIEKAKKEIYIKYQKASGLKVGDTVRVLRKASPHENGWNNFWVDSMNSNIDRIDKIRSIDGAVGITLESGIFNYPFFVLEKVAPKPKPMEVLIENEWVKSMNPDEIVGKYTMLGNDNKYNYFTYYELLYRQKKDG